MIGNKFDEKYFVKFSDGFGNLQYYWIDILLVNFIVFFDIYFECGKLLDIFVMVGRKLMLINYQFKVCVLDFLFCIVDFKSFGYCNCSKNFYEVLLISNVIGKIGIYYIGVMFVVNKIEKVQSCELWFCGGKGGCQKCFCIGVKDFLIILFLILKIIVLEYNNNIDVNYMMLVIVISCLYWFEKKQIWINEGCLVG